jgi:hypothetical protein
MTDVRRSSVAALDRFEVNIASSGLAPWVLTPWTIHDTRSDLGGANSCMDFESKKHQDYPEGTARCRVNATLASSTSLAREFDGRYGTAHRSYWTP